MDPELNEIFQPEIRIKKLKLENFRGFEQLELEFHRDLTVLIGDNGAGKTAILDCLAILLNIFTTEIIKEEKNLGHLVNNIGILDIKTGKFETTAEICLVDYKQATEEVNYGITFTKDYESRIFLKITIPWNTTNRKNLPILIYYPTSTVAFINFIDFKNARDDFRTDILTIYDHALDKKSFNFTYFFEWYRWQENIEKQLGKNPILDQVRQAIYSLLRDEHNQFDNLAINWLNNPSGEMLIQKNATVLNINQLSSGEKTLLALVADLARRLAIANPHREQPLTGYGIVLIDEIDLHLHPRWQRHIIPKLRQIFPNCQLIVTTHSPIVLGNIQPENIIILENFTAVPNKHHSFGREVNSVLADIMGVSPRSEEMQTKINHCFNLIDKGELTQAKALLETLSKTLGSNDPDIVYGESLLNFMEE